MSASLLNLAALPGAGAQPGASQGIGAQAAQAGQAKGPLAGFEALLAAFFGDQGTTDPSAAASAPGQAAAAVQGALALAGKGPAAGDGKDSKDKAAGATGDGKPDGATDTTQADATAGAALDASALLAAPVIPLQPAAAVSSGGPDIDTDAGDGAPNGLAAKSAAPARLAELAAAAEARGSKAAIALAKAAANVGPPTQGQVSGKPDQPATPPAAVATTPPAGESNLQEPVLPDAAPVLAADAPTAALSTLQGDPPPALPLPAQASDTARAAVAKEKVQGPKAPRVEGVRVDLAAVAPGAKAVDPLAPADISGKDAGADERDPNAPPAPEAKDGAPAPSANDFNVATNAAAQANSATSLAHAAAVRGSPQTVANLAAQIAKKLDGRSTRFDVQLEPAGLGKVDVRVEIDAAGKMSAAMAFDNQQAANELKSRAGELHRALEQAGFDLSGGLSFDVAGQDGRAPGQNADNPPAFRGRAFQAVLDGEADASALTQSYLRRGSATGVDIRI
ncbi:MAG: flagellar hook-length control protein FliK [Phenylobacterium sp.]